MPGKSLFIQLPVKPFSKLIRFLSFSVLVSALQAYGQTAIAVLDLESDVSFSDENVDTICAAINGEIAKNPDFTVFDRQYLPFILESSGIRRDEPCSDTRCLASIGMKIGANQVVGGTVQTVKKGVELTLVRIDAVKGEVLQTVSGEIGAEKEVFMNDVLPGIVKSLLNDEIAPATKTENNLTKDRERHPGILIGTSTLLAGGAVAAAVYYFHFRKEYTSGPASLQSEDDKDIPMDDIPERGRD
jgi:hypothetical protein